MSATITDRHFDVNFSTPAGAITAIIGPNGAGKSTLLQIIAGILLPDHAIINLDGKILTDTTTRLSIKPHHRGIVLLSQDPLLFPHLTVRNNILFSLRQRYRGIAHFQYRRREAQRWLDTVGLSEYGEKKPHQLSGGQAQRVAIARALAAQPNLLLLDEPFKGLDVLTCSSMRTMLTTLHRNYPITTLIVTHDLIDLYTLAHYIIVIESGHISEISPAREVLSRPQSQFGAHIAGLNQIIGLVKDNVLHTRSGHKWVGHSSVADGPGKAVFRSRSIHLHDHDPHLSVNCVEIILSNITSYGASVMIHGRIVEEESTTIIAECDLSTVGHYSLQPAQHMWVSVESCDLELY